MGRVMKTFSFYSVTTTGDGEMSEVSISASVDGRIETEEQMISEDPNQTIFTQLLIFYSDKILDGIVTGVKVVDDDDGTEYLVQYEETYDDHQEISLRKINP
jgi:hypothetical protein